jgi:hypothetical protein
MHGDVLMTPMGSARHNTNGMAAGYGVRRKYYQLGEIATLLRAQHSKVSE